MQKRLAIIGDVGGHAQQFIDMLYGLGADVAKGTIPSDLHICQVGDLVHKGPHTPDVLRVVGNFLENSPEQWTQLIGNHEAQHILTSPWFWEEGLPDSVGATLRTWWEEKKIQTSAAFTLEESPYCSTTDLLVTHAGLTAGLWRRIGSPLTAQEASDVINEKSAKNASPVWKTGLMLGSGRSFRAGVVWAEAVGEVYLSWYKEAASMPEFSQAHGHTTPFWWSKGEVNRSFAEMPESTLRVSEETHLARTEVRGRTFWSTDPGSSERVATAWKPLILPLRS